MIRISRLFATYTNFFKAAAWTTKCEESKGMGEDAFLVSPKLIALCDGLSSWRIRGLDPGKHPWQLVKNIEKAHNFLPEEIKYHPQAVMRQAAKETTELGSSTCVIAILHPEKPQLFCGNLGDSGMMILRKQNNDVVKVVQTTEVVESFDKPFTLGLEGKSPDDAFYASYDIQDKDIVVLYSDGVSHNLFADHILRLVKPFMLLNEIPDLEIVAEMITEKAQSQSVDPQADKPYGEETGDYKQGKINDATIVIGEINIKNIEV